MICRPAWPFYNRERIEFNTWRFPPAGVGKSMGASQIGSHGASRLFKSKVFLSAPVKLQIEKEEKDGNREREAKAGKKCFGRPLSHSKMFLSV